MDGKTKAIVAHLWLIGWVIALVLNMNDKDELASFYIRQLLGLFLASLVLMFIPVVGWLLNIVIFVFWIISLIGAVNGEKKEIPLLGKYFQEWFHGL